MKISKLPPIEVLRENLDYNPQTGELRWKTTTKGRRAGQLAGRTTHQGYIELCFNYRYYKAHRICWALYYGEDPYPYLIDHKRGVDEGNKIDNLRKATNSENCHNTKLHCRNKSGHRGVFYHKRDKKWVAKITINRQQIYLGWFDDREEAIAARLTAEREYNIFVRE